ncbi:hypothetical protein H0H93_007363 [Arthromyces matolae]|nr:hypothetical protein H0H93_007363 [Arthromyces matolae]
MKTTLMQQVIAAAIFSLVTTRTFATPMPTTVATSRDVPSYIYPRNDDVVSTNHGHDHHRKPLAAPIPAIIRSVNELHAGIGEVNKRFDELAQQLASTGSTDITLTSEVLQSTLAAHDIRTRLSFSETEVFTLASKGLSIGIQHVANLLAHHKDLGIDETKGTPLIQDMIKALKKIMFDNLDEGSIQFGKNVLHYIDHILKFELGWNVIHELQLTRSQLDKKIKASRSSCLMC